MFHPVSRSLLVAHALVLLGPVLGHADPSATERKGRQPGHRVRHFEVYFGPGGRRAEPTAKFIERSRLVVPADWVVPLRARTAELSDVRWVRRHELTQPSIGSGLGWDAGLALLPDMTEDERRECERTLPPASRSAGVPNDMALPRIVRVTASFPIALMIPNRDQRDDEILVVRSPYPAPPLPPRYVPFGGTVKATSDQIAFLVDRFGAMSFEGEPGDLRFKVAATHLGSIAAWLNGPNGPRDTPLREAREEFGEYGILSPPEISDLYAAQHGEAYRALSAEVRRHYH